MLCSLFLFPIFFIKCKGLTETKHMSGGVFGWPDALKSQRNLWGGVNFKFFKFYKSEPNLSDIVVNRLLDNVDINLTKTIDDLMDKIRDKFGSFSGSSETDDQEKDEVMNLKLSSISQYFQKSFRNSNQLYLMDSDEKCGSEYPNAKLIGKIIEKEECEYNDQLLGELFSYILIIIPILIMGVLAFIFYIVFCFGCCCCCKAKYRNCPGVVSIVFFSLITACMLIAVCFHVVGAVYLLNIINYFTSDKLFDEVEEIMNLVEPTVNNAITGVSADISSSVQTMSQGISDVINQLFPSLDSGIQSVSDNLSIFSRFFNDLNKMTDEQKKNVSQYEGYYNNNFQNNDEVCLIKLSQDENFMNFSQLPLIIEELKAQFGEMSVADGLSNFSNDLGDTLNETFGEITDLFNFSNISLGDLGKFGELSNIRDKFDYEKYVKPWMLTVAKAMLFVVSFFMLLILALQICAFWTKNCCSRCIVCACCPCCFCSCCQTICGLLATAAGFLLLLINLVYYQGDEIVNRTVAKFTNDDKRIVLGSLDLSNISKEIISELPLPDLEIEDLYIVKSIVDAKLDSTLADLLDFKHLPFRSLADGFNESFYYAANNSVNVDLIKKPVENVINSITETILEQFDMLDAMNISGLKQFFDTYDENQYKTCKTEDLPKKEQYETLKESYDIFITAFNAEIVRLEGCKSDFKNSTGQVPQDIGRSVKEVFGGFIISLGSTFSNTIGKIETIFKNVDAKFLIALFNVVRVRILYQLMGYCMCVSISAHLYIVGMWAMVILLWVRRKGMAYEGKEQPTEDEYSISYSYSEEDPKNTKKRSRNVSNGENSSDDDDDIKDVELVTNNSNQSRDDDEKSTSMANDSDTFDNPYKQESDNSNNEEISKISNDESSTINFNDGSSIADQKIEETEDNELSFNESTTANNNIDRSSSDADSNNDDNQQTYVF